VILGAAHRRVIRSTGKSLGVAVDHRPMRPRPRFDGEYTDRSDMPVYSSRVFCRPRGPSQLVLTLTPPMP
jgi:hypothetical protein